ncbi:MAG: SIS domain-containing protein [Candidatus Hydrogenedentota bacterium]
MTRLAQLFEAASDPADYARRYTAHLADILQAVDTAAIGRIIAAFDRVCDSGHTLYFIANGGSAAVASHWVNDLVAGAYVEGIPPVRAFCLTDNVASVTALANDDGYDDIFTYQLRACLQPGDLVYAMSVSGQSENIIRAVDFAKSRAATTVGVCGLSGGKLKDRCDITLHVPATPDEYGPVEDVFAVLDHIVSGYLAMKRGKKLDH